MKNIRSSPISIWVAALLASLELSPALVGSTLAQTQLKGLTAVNVSVHVSGDLGPNAHELENLARALVAKCLGGAGIALVAINGETLRIEIEGVRANCSSGPASVVVRVKAQLVEHVTLNRNSRDVPGGGAITWWRDGMEIGSEGRVEKLAEDALDYFIGSLLDEWRIENTDDSKTRPR